MLYIVNDAADSVIGVLFSLTIITGLNEVHATMQMAVKARKSILLTVENLHNNDSKGSIPMRYVRVEYEQNS